MGIHGLWPLLEPTSTAITLDALEGKRLAIDVSFWLYQAQQGYNKNVQNNTKNPHLLLMLNRITKLVFYKIRPVFVFDGKNIPQFKKQILRDRCLKKHLNEISGSKDKKLFERIAKEQLSSVVENSVDEFAENQKKAAKIFNEQNYLDLPSTSNTNQIATTITSAELFDVSDSEHTSDFDENETGIYSSILDAQISKLEEVKERQKNAKLQPWEIPENSKEFSQFQLERLVKKNKLSTQLDKLRADKTRKTIQINLPLNGSERKLIVTDKQRRTHVLTKNEGIHVIETEKMEKYDLTWPKFLQLQTNQINLPTDDSNENKNDYFSNSDDGESDEFIEVSDLEDGIMHFPEEMIDSDCQIDEEIEKIIDKSNKIDIIVESDQDADYIEKMTKKDEEEDYFRPKNQGIAHYKFNFFKQNNETDDGIYADCQNLLTFLGLPFMQAPAEAEAQCVELERLNLVDGVVSDDSDVWLFGGKQIYKNVFSRRRDIQKYNSDEIKQKLGLNRSEFIQLGMLAGGDYSRGFEKIGMVAALELVSEFIPSSKQFEGNDLEKAFESLKNIRKWILSKNNSENGNFVESAHQIRLRKIIEANNSEDSIKLFPNEDIFKAYSNPLVDNTTQKFRWKRINFSELEKFVDDKIGLPKQQIEKMTYGAFQRWDEFMAKQTQSYQPRITEFPREDNFSGILAHPSNFTLTERVQKALEKLKKKNSTELSGKEENEEDKIKSSKITTTNKIGSKNRKRKQKKRRPTPPTKKTKTSSNQKFTLSEESSSSSD